MLHNDWNDVGFSSVIFESSARLLETEEYENIGPARSLFAKLNFCKSLKMLGLKLQNLVSLCALFVTTATGLQADSHEKRAGKNFQTQ
jgi:hypothetical protein